MKSNKKTTVYLMAFYIVIFSSSCHDRFLDLKRDKQQVVPNSLKDYDAMLDNTAVFNTTANLRLMILSSDDHFINKNRWQSLIFAEEINSYIWAKDIYEGGVSTDWNQGYQRVLYSNIVLEGLHKLARTTSNMARVDHLIGSALFFRSWSFYHLAQTFSKTYDPKTAKIDLGIPLRLESNITLRVERASVENTYMQVVQDLQEASKLLEAISEPKTRPSKVAALAALSRVYMQMGDYDNAINYADSCLSYHNKLIDYENIDFSLRFPFKRYNDEVIFHDDLSQMLSTLSPWLNVDSTLFKSYTTNDLRKDAWFYKQNDVLSYKGSYDGSDNMFVGLTTSEIYLILAESHARLGNIQKANLYLNILLKNRIKDYDDLAIQDKDVLLETILTERRKELIFRGLRWADLKRLNKDPRFQVTLQRNLEGEIYELNPNDNRYVFPIPDAVIRMSNVEQNKR